MTNFREQYVDADGKDVRPIVMSGICRSDRFPSRLFTIDEVQTVFHEFDTLCTDCFRVPILPSAERA